MDGIVDFVIGPEVYKKDKWNDDPVIKRDTYSYPSRPAFDPTVKNFILLSEKYPNGIYMTDVRKVARDKGFDNFIMMDEISKKPIWETDMPYSNNIFVEKYITNSKNIVSDENIGVEV